MSFIHYKLITNQNYEKIAFDGVSLSVGELKKLILEKKFRKYTSSSSSAPTISRKSDIDLEVTNVDTNEVYQKDTDLIPKNSRVQINRVVKNIGPAIAGGTIRLTHKESEQMENLKLKQQQLQQLKKEPETSQEKTLDLNVLIQPVSPKTLQPSPGANLYADLLNEEDSLNSSQFINDQPANEQKSQLPHVEILCPFEENNERHLMENAVIVPCCGYFICCEKCIKTKLDNHIYVECPREDCQQEITVHHRLTPYKPIRQKVTDYLVKNPNSPSHFSKDLFEVQSDKPKAPQPQQPSTALLKVLSEPIMKKEQEQTEQKLEAMSIEPVKTEKVPNKSDTSLKRSRSLSPISTNSEKSSMSKVTSDSSSKASQNASNQSIDSVSSASKSSLSLSDVTESTESTSLRNSESSVNKRSRSLSPSALKPKEEDQKGKETKSKEVEEKSAVQLVQPVQEQIGDQAPFQPQAPHSFIPQMAPLNRPHHHAQPHAPTYHHPPHTFQTNRQYGRMATPYGQQYPAQQVYPGYGAMPPILTQPPPFMYGAPHDMSYLRQHPMNIPPSMPYSHYPPSTQAQFGWNANIPQAMHHQMPPYYEQTSTMMKPQVSRETKHLRRSSRSRSRSRPRRGEGRGADGRGGERKRRSSRSRSRSSSRSSRDKRRRYKTRSRSSSRHARYSKRSSHRDRRSRTRSRSASRTRHYKSTRRDDESTSKRTSTTDRRERSRDRPKRDRSSDSSHKQRQPKTEASKPETKDTKPSSDKKTKKSSRDIDDSFESVSNASSTSSSSKSSELPSVPTATSTKTTTSTLDTTLKETSSVKQVERGIKTNDGKETLTKPIGEEPKKNESPTKIIKLNNNGLKSPTKSIQIDSVHSPVKCLSPSSASNSSTSSPTKKPKRLVHLKKELAAIGIPTTPTKTPQSPMKKELKTNGENHANVVQQTLSISSHEEDVLDISINEKDHSL